MTLPLTALSLTSLVVPACLILLVFLASLAAQTPRRPGPAWPAPWRALRAWRVGAQTRDRGMSTAEYAVGTLAAVAFAGVLLAVVKSPAVHTLVSSVVQRALSASF